ncbi:hypothetical protein CPLU01_03394 [Colletotrichum plurivorum]|uniref:Uncharacterized protein n=1 Tax=Colletotrichum plurivorum TaxID=2175906 RepID=A0A8H6KTF7_9PEZI|nr:hypothetical protein CPLU01_03394 [Colletotrichum plurivorum]
MTEARSETCGFDWTTWAAGATLARNNMAGQAKQGPARLKRRQPLASASKVRVWLTGISRFPVPRDGNVELLQMTEEETGDGAKAAKAEGERRSMSGVWVVASSAEQPAARSGGMRNRPEGQTRIARYRLNRAGPRNGATPAVRDTARRRLAGRAGGKFTDGRLMFDDEAPLLVPGNCVYFVLTGSYGEHQEGLALQLRCLADGVAANGTFPVSPMGILHSQASQFDSPIVPRGVVPSQVPELYRQRSF